MNARVFDVLERKHDGIYLQAPGCPNWHRTEEHIQGDKLYIRARTRYNFLYHMGKYSTIVSISEKVLHARSKYWAA